MKVLILLSRFPWPLIKGDKLRAYHQIVELSKSCEVYLCALSDEKVPDASLKAVEAYCKEVHVLRLSPLSIASNVLYHFVFTNKPAQVGYFYNSKNARKFRSLVKRIQPNQIFCQLIRTSEYVKGINDIPLTLDYMDALSAGMERREKSGNSIIDFFVRSESRRLKKYEFEVFSKFDHHTIISKPDRDLIFQYNNEDIVVLPNGIDSNYFEAKEQKKEFDLLFTGNMSYPPNVQSVQYLVNEIMPLVWDKNPNVRLMISGANPDKRILKLGSDRIRVQGWIEDIREAYNQSRVFIAPMLIGSGMQNKLLEAMSMKLPCITSELANLALGAVEDEEILVGRSSREYATHILNLLENEQQQKSLAEKGHTFVREKFNWAHSNEILINLFKEHAGTKE